MASRPQPDDVTFVAHPPERARRSTTLLSPGCCCCCCCCVHSLGSLAGAIYGMRTGHPPPTPGLSGIEARKEAAERQVANAYAIKLYWFSLLIVAIITMLVSLGANEREGLLIGVFVVAICLPAGQLIASVLALIYINVFPPVRKPECLRRLGRITLFSFIWGLIGSALTWLILAGMN